MKRTAKVLKGSGVIAIIQTKTMKLRRVVKGMRRTAKPEALKAMQTAMVGMKDPTMKAMAEAAAEAATKALAKELHALQGIQTVKKKAAGVL